MITVRFPSGFSVQYNDLDHADFRSTGIYLSKKTANNTYQVWAPLTCIIEHVTPCRTYNPTSIGMPQIDRVVAAVELLAKDVRSLKRKLAK